MEVKYYECASIPTTDVYADDMMYNDLLTTEIRNKITDEVGFKPDRCFIMGDMIFAVKEKQQSKYILPYEPVCPFGYTDCINDPAYIKYHYPDWYDDLYGNLSPQEAAEKDNCVSAWLEYGEEKACPNYDDEDK